MQANLPQHTTLRLKVKALKARVHCVCRHTRPLRLRQRHWKLIKGGMNSRVWMKKDPKIVYLAYKITAHTTNCMDIYNLQHIVLHAACLLAAGILSRPCRKCEDIMPLLARSIIMYYCIKIVSPCVHDALVPRREAFLNIDT